ncbi:MFS transporter [Rhizorhabdus sp. FW153]|uniref:MFS transporter n=1 Tax=Rhizorhabdus sp. FW153 TaxID=3400216 RepID=UPI003CEDD674
MVALLFLAGIFSVIDRGVLAIVVDPVRQDIGIGDERIALLQGLAFGLFYALMGMPMGLLADRTSRKRLVAAGIALWSVATIGSGLAQGFGSLFAARLMVGLGEAALGPCAISLIADLFPADRRGRPISLYMMGQGLANGLAITLTGLVLTHAAQGAFAGIPLLEALAPWRIAFVLFGAGGIGVAAAIALLTQEPERKGAAIPASAKGVAGAAELRWLWANRGVTLPLYLGFAICFTAAYGAGAWTPSLLLRGYGVSPAFLGAWLGPFAMAFSATGPLLGGWLLDRAMQQGRDGARFAILRLAPLCAIPSGLAVLAGDPRLAAILIASSNAVFACVGTVMFATLQTLVPSNMRGSAISLTLVLNTLLGATLGPLLVATLTERVFGDPTKVGWSIAMVVLPCVVGASLLYALAARNMKLRAQS